jgi:hypothetical protein
MVRFDRPRVRERTPDQRELDAFIAGEPRWRLEISVGPRRGLRRRGYRGREGRVVGDEALILLDPFVGEAPHRRRRRCCREGCELDVRDGGGTGLEERDELGPEAVGSEEEVAATAPRGDCGRETGLLALV